MWLLPEGKGGGRRVEAGGGGICAPLPWLPPALAVAWVSQGPPTVLMGDGGPFWGLGEGAGGGGSCWGARGRRGQGRQIKFMLLGVLST